MRHCDRIKFLLRESVRLGPLVERNQAWGRIKGKQSMFSRISPELYLHSDMIYSQTLYIEHYVMVRRPSNLGIFEVFQHLG